MPRRTDGDLLRAIGARVRAVREARGFTQAALAEAVGMQPESVSRLESGHRGVSITSLAQLAQALGATLSEVVGVERPVPHPPLTENEQELLDVWRRLPGPARTLALELLLASERHLAAR